jgi:hypothetical protein
MDRLLHLHGGGLLNRLKFLVVAGGLAVASGLAVTAGCGRAVAPARAAVTDSAVPWDEALRRFRAGMVEPTELSHGAPSRATLVGWFVRAAGRGDGEALRRLALTPAEFAWFFYPTSPYARPPYDLSPEVFWLTLDAEGGSGLARLLAQFGGRPVGFAGYSCPALPSVEGENRVHAPCTVRVAGDTLGQRMFGPIIERDGRFKFVNLANRLD